MDLSQSNKPRIFVVSVDGSDKAEVAFQTCADELMGKKDVVNVISVTDVSKDYLPMNYRPKYILQKYKTECIGRFPHDRFEIMMYERKQNCDVKEQIAMIAHKHEANYVVMGSSGRKGQKEDAYRVGQTAMHMLENCKVPLVIIKKPYQREKNDTKGFNFQISYDGSKAAMKMIKVAKDLARHSNDRVYAVHICEDEEQLKEDLENEFKTECENNKCALEEIYIAEKDVDSTVPEFQNKWANQSEKVLYDFLLLGATGMTAQRQNKYFSGKVLTYMLRKTVLNTIIVP